MAQYIRYADFPEAERERRAIIDIIRYIGATRYKLLVRMAKDANTNLQAVNFSMAFCGVSGFPFHAFAKRYMPKKYEAWITEPDTGDIALLD